MKTKTIDVSMEKIKTLLQDLFMIHDIKYFLKESVYDNLYSSRQSIRQHTLEVNSPLSISEFILSPIVH
jgi:hypothetical protein